MILGVALFQASGADADSKDVAWIFFPWSWPPSVSFARWSASWWCGPV